MEFIDFLRQMDRMCECADHCQNCPLNTATVNRRNDRCFAIFRE